MWPPETVALRSQANAPAPLNTLIAPGHSTRGDQARYGNATTALGGAALVGGVAQAGGVVTQETYWEKLQNAIHWMAIGEDFEKGLELWGPIYLIVVNI